MRTGNRPSEPKCPLGRLYDSGMDAEAIKAQGWKQSGILVVSVNDERLSWTDVELIKQLGERLYGKLPDCQP